MATATKRLRGKSPKLAKPSRPQVVIFGPPGVGKTWQALDFPACYYIDCEGGANLPHYTTKLESVGASYLGPEDGANDFQVVIEEVMTLATTHHDRRTLILDSFSKLFQTCVQVEYDRLLAQGKKAEFGIERKPAISQTRRLVRWLDQLDMNVILICHEKAEWAQGEQVGVTFDGYEKLAYEMNLVLQIFRTGKTRRAKVVKTRFDCFEEGEVCEWSYDEFAKRFGEDVMQAESESVELAQPDQVAEIRSLIEVLKISDEDVAKVWDDAGVTRWEDMPADRIRKAIDKLTAKIKGGK